MVLIHVNVYGYLLPYSGQYNGKFNETFEPSIISPSVQPLHLHASTSASPLHSPIVVKWYGMLHWSNDLTQQQPVYNRVTFYSQTCTCSYDYREDQPAQYHPNLERQNSPQLPIQ